MGFFHTKRELEAYIAWGWDTLENDLAHIEESTTQHLNHEQQKLDNDTMSMEDKFGSEPWFSETMETIAQTSWEQFGPPQRLPCTWGGDNCCTSATPCGQDEGDCDSDADCRAGLICGTDNCPVKEGLEWDSTDDCCYQGQGPN